MRESGKSLQVVPGSLKAIADAGGMDVMSVLMDVEAIILLDQSGSMAAHDTRDGRSRYNVADEELQNLQAMYPGKLALVEFSDRAQFCPGGMPTRMGRGTNMIAPLEWIVASGADGLFDIIMVSDGEPDEESRTLDFARRMKGAIHTIHIGPDGGYGADFLRRLAAATGGRRFEADKPGELGAGVIALLSDGG